MKRSTFVSKRFFHLLISALALPVVFSACGNGTRPAVAEDGWIGVYAQDLDRDLQRFLDLNERDGVLVNEVVKNSPADDAGLREEDVIVKFDGKSIRDIDDLHRAVRRKKAGDRVRVEILRDGERERMGMRIGERPRRFARRDREPDQSDMPHRFNFRSSGAWLGLRLSKLNEDLAAYFDVSPDEGVLVLKVLQDTPAESAGLKAGDIISRIDGRDVREPEDVSSALRDFEAGDKVEIEIRRKGRQQTVEVELESRTWRSHVPFDHGDWEEFHRGLRDFRSEFGDRRFQVEIPFEDINDELERALNNLDRELNLNLDDLEKGLDEMERELDNLDIKIELKKRGRIL